MARKELDSATKRAAKQGLLIVIVAVFTLEATAVPQYFYSQHILSEEATRRAEGQLAATELHISNVVDQVETAVRNSVWSVEQQMYRPDSLAAITVRLVESNPVICGSTVAMVDKNLAPYSYQQDGKVLTSSLATEAYDYKHQEWFVKPLELQGGYWSEPYYDEGGGNMLMTTYSIPVSDKRGRVAAVFTADVSLDWLTELVGSVQVYPSAFSMVVSRAGQIMVCPAETLVMRHTVQDMAANTTDTATFNSINRSMLSGEAGNTRFKYEGKVHYMFFDSVDRTGWAMSIVIPHNEIYGNIERLGQIVSLLMLLGIVMIIVILYHTIRNQRDMNLIEENKHRLEGELKVARGIQMSMIPKIFPPYPERGDIDMFAAVVPAKEVGGDLYDFYIRDEKLFFCIGDVSGKGVPASLVMAVTRSLFRTVSAHEKSPQRIVTTMNDSMSDMNESNMFVTFFCGVLDLQNGHLRYCNAGHNAPVLVGEERMMNILQAGVESRVLIDTISNAVHTFADGAPQSDDLTMLYIRFMNSRKSEETERHLILHNDIQQIPQLAEFVEAVADLAHLDVGLTMSLNLALEEAVSNVIMYAYPKGSDGLVDVEAIVRKDSLEFILSDNGTPFDPTAAPEADITLDVEDRPIGGLGIFLVRNIMDEVKYTRSDDGKNILSMTKKLA